jgi:hypothetical protein
MAEVLTRPESVQVGSTARNGAEQSVEAFERDRASLFAIAPGRWVAYAWGDRLAIGKTQHELYDYCLKDLNLDHDAFVVRLIAPALELEVDLPLR